MYIICFVHVGATVVVQRADVARGEVEVARVAKFSVSHSRPQSSIDCGYSFLYCIPDIKPSIHVSRLIILFAYFKYASSAVLRNVFIV